MVVHCAEHVLVYGVGITGTKTLHPFFLKGFLIVGLHGFFHVEIGRGGFEFAAHGCGEGEVGRLGSSALLEEVLVNVFVLTLMVMILKHQP